uniref:Fibronectin type-III domain-containing protein 3a n=1 Tax=Magallana gigas TaxID=29159 RepID=K1Q9V5_MAGGI
MKGPKFRDLGDLTHHVSIHWPKNNRCIPKPRVSIPIGNIQIATDAPLKPEFNDTRPYEAPNVTINWTPRNPDVDLYYIYLKGHDNMSIPNSTNETSLTLIGLKPGTNYMFTVIQQTNGPYARAQYKIAVFTVNDAFNSSSNTILGPPKDTCTISNDTTLMENQKIMSLLVDNLRRGTTYTLSVVGYNEAGEGKKPRTISLRTMSRKPDPVNLQTFHFDTSRRVVTWNSPPFPGDDLEYRVSLEDALKGGVVSRSTTSVSSFNLPSRLYNYYNYTVVVVAHTSAGTATPSQYPFTTLHAGKLGAPQGTKIIEYTCERIKITWFEMDVRLRNGPITGYKFKNKDGSHNGHSVESLSTVYKRTTDQAREQKEKIDNILLPKYRELVSNETAKESALKRRAEEIKKKIEAHTESLVEMIITIGTQTVEDLSKKEKDGLREIEQTKNNFKKQIDELQLMSRTISTDIEAKPGVSFFKLVEKNNLDRFERTLPNTDYSLTDFQPGDIKLAIQDNFGTRPILQRSGNMSSVSKMNCSFNKQFSELSSYTYTLFD